MNIMFPLATNRPSWTSFIRFNNILRCDVIRSKWTARTTRCWGPPLNSLVTRLSTKSCLVSYKFSVTRWPDCFFNIQRWIFAQKHTKSPKVGSHFAKHWKKLSNVAKEFWIGEISPNLATLVTIQIKHPPYSQCFLKGQSRPPFVYFCLFYMAQVKYKLIKVLMVCLGLEPVLTG